MAEGTCAVEGCENYGPLKRTWCVAHYLRWYRHGGPPPPEGRRGRPPGGPCSVEDCTRKHYAKGYCNLHWQRLHKYGDPMTLRTGGWLGDAVGYSAVHERLVRSRGSASTHTCAHCGDTASDWAYDGTCPDERLGERHGRLLAYSTDPHRYMPLCRPCHTRYDTT